ncbi:MAG: YgaC family protein [Lachnospiraceae bacterium]|nr:YgaC family protein [Lachnospiraceae bacterium]
MINALYRRRLIPNECVLLKDDTIIHRDDDRLVTTWNALKPKKELACGISGFFPADGIKVSKFYRKDKSLIYWYIDIICAEWIEGTPDLSMPCHANAPQKGLLAKGFGTGSLLVTDLLADILIYPDGFVKVVDLAEISDALEQNLLDQKSAALALRTLDRTLESIYRGSFKEYQEFIESLE